jgi:uncharacterized protein YcfJ
VKRAWPGNYSIALRLVGVNRRSGSTLLNPTPIKKREERMKTTYLIAPALLMAATNAQAFEAVAQVVHTVPITETVNQPTQQCWTESRAVTQAAPRDYTGAILGTIAGGIIGSQIGKGKGKIAAGAVGAGIGAVTGDRLANRDAYARTTTVPVRHCQTVDNFETHVTGYRVTYSYDGRRFTTRLPYDPGNQLRVNVAVTPK